MSPQITTIRPFEPNDVAGIAAVVVPIQQEEFGIPISYEDQPDLRDIPAFYQLGLGEFWVAANAEGTVVGTIGLKDIGGDSAALRKMFVSADHRGDGTAGRLLSTLVGHAANVGLTRIYLGTTAKFITAHRFYEKNAFVEIGANMLPPGFPRMAVDSKFYRYDVEPRYDRAADSTSRGDDQ